MNTLLESTASTTEEVVSYLGVNYHVVHTRDGGQLYLTDYGWPIVNNLLPQNWHELKWFAQKRQRLAGSSSIYRVPTRPVGGRSIDLVVRYSRMAQEVAMDNLMLREYPDAEFHTPFEEFSMVMDLRRGWFGPQNLRIRTKRPLAIYSPPGQMDAWQSGRVDYAIRRISVRHPGLPLDMARSYMVVYEWIDGSDAQQAAELMGLSDSQRKLFLETLGTHVIGQLRCKGFYVADMKPAHIIVRFDKHGHLLNNRDGSPAYALIDYELLMRTHDYECYLSKRLPSEG